MSNVAWGPFFAPKSESLLTTHERQAQGHPASGDVVTIMVVDRDMRALVAETIGSAASRRRWALVNGGMEPQESPLGAAQRWLQRQTGCAAADWRYLGSSDASGHTAHFFMAQKVYEAGPPADDAEACAAYRWIPLSELRQALWDGRIEGEGAAANIALGLLSLS